MSEIGAGVSKSTAAAALLESMRAVQQALRRPHGLSPDQVIARIEEWQHLVTELATGAAQGTELATLYEMIGVLNSSLDLGETLSLVMDSLIHLTGAGRGCLMLLDEAGNLAIRATQNFDQESVESSDLELSHTVVRSAVEEGQPVLTTNAQLDPRFADRESVVGYHLRSIVCVPLQSRGRGIGALYLDNPMRDGVFSQTDLPILTAFASQAAIAIENARLYTMTDQALAARVEELTTMQQVDQELNSSLDVERVLELTLAWAMRALGADGGRLSLVDEAGKVGTVWSAGDEEVAEPEAEVVQGAMASREPLLADHGTRLLVPIRYEEQALGLMVLQNRQGVPLQSDHIQFAGQLADHAAIAIENARLYEQVRQANRAKSEFVSIVSHELRTPMTSVRGYADMLEKGMAGTLSAQQAEFVRTINRNAERMQVLVSDLQDVSRIETGQLQLKIESATLAEALDSALQATQSQIEARSQQLTLEVPEDLPPVHADRARLTQVLTNLLSNAYKYTREGGQICVRAWLEDGYVHCAVADTGVGMSPEDQARLFTKFFRSEDPAVREVSGTGLGLCIVKSLVEMQGGEMQVESELGIGTTMTFTVPVVG